MDSSTLVFRAANGQFSVWSCACGCDLAVHVTPQMEHDVLAVNRARARFYIKHHAPLGIDYAHKGNIYDFAASEPLGAALLPAHADVLAADKNSMVGQWDALQRELEVYRTLDDSDDDEKTPTVHFWLKDDHD